MLAGDPNQPERFAYRLAGNHRISGIAMVEVPISSKTDLRIGVLKERFESFPRRCVLIDTQTDQAVGTVLRKDSSQTLEDRDRLGLVHVSQRVGSVEPHLVVFIGQGQFQCLGSLRTADGFELPSGLAGKLRMAEHSTASGQALGDLLGALGKAQREDCSQVMGRIESVLRKRSDPDLPIIPSLGYRDLLARILIEESTVDRCLHRLDPVHMSVLLGHQYRHPRFVFDPAAA